MLFRSWDALAVKGRPLTINQAIDEFGDDEVIAAMLRGWVVAAIPPDKANDSVTRLRLTRDQVVEARKPKRIGRELANPPDYVRLYAVEIVD